MKRELKAAHSPHCTRNPGGSDHIPMKRELKEMLWALKILLTCSGSDHIPMKRELKVYDRGIVGEGLSRFRPHPYEEGTESLQSSGSVTL